MKVERMVYGIRAYTGLSVTKERQRKVKAQGSIAVMDENGKMYAVFKLKDVPIRPPVREPGGEWLRFEDPWPLKYVDKIYGPVDISTVEFLLHPEGGETVMHPVESLPNFRVP